MPAEKKEVVYGKNSYLVRVIFKKQDDINNSLFREITKFNPTD
jgi:hypothetical protein